MSALRKSDPESMRTLRGRVLAHFPQHTVHPGIGRRSHLEAIPEALEALKAYEEALWQVSTYCGPCPECGEPMSREMYAAGGYAPPQCLRHGLPPIGLDQQALGAAANVFMSFLPNNNRATSDFDRYGAGQVIKAYHDYLTWPMRRG